MYRVFPDAAYLFCTNFLIFTALLQKDYIISFNNTKDLEI